MSFSSIWLAKGSLLNHQTFLDTVSNNVANANTVGFKRSDVKFAEVFTETLKPATEEEGNRAGRNPIQKGKGTVVASIIRDLKQGNIEHTDISTNIAILGNGYFILSDPYSPGNYLYTRAGDFVFDADMTLVNAENGYFVQGVIATYNTSSGQYEIQGTTLENITDLPTVLPGQPTTIIRLQGNLNAEAETPINPISIQYERAINVTSNRYFDDPATVITPNPWPVQSIASLELLTSEVVPASSSAEKLSIRYSDNDLETFVINPGMTLQQVVDLINTQSIDVIASAYLDPDNNRYYLQLIPQDPNNKAVYQVYESPSSLGGFTEGYIPNEEEQLKVTFSNGVSRTITIPEGTTLQGLVDLINDDTSGIPYLSADILEDDGRYYLQLTPDESSISITSIPIFPRAFKAKFNDPNTSDTDESISSGFTSGVEVSELEFRFKRVHPAKNIYRYEAYENNTKIQNDDTGLSIAGLIEINEEGKIKAHYRDTTGTDEFIDLSANENPTDNDRFGIINPSHTVDGYDFYTINGVDVLIPNGVQKKYQPDHSQDLLAEDFIIKAKTDEGLRDSAVSNKIFDQATDIITPLNAEKFSVIFNDSSADEITVPVNSSVQDFVNLVNDPQDGIEGLTATLVQAGQDVYVRLQATTGGESFTIVSYPSGFNGGFEYELGNLAVIATNMEGNGSLKDSIDYTYGFSTTIYDSVGNKHDITFEYQRLSQNRYLYTISPIYKATFTSAPIEDNPAGGGTTRDGLTLPQGDLRVKDLNNNLYDVTIKITEDNSTVEFTQVSAFPQTGADTNYFIVTDPTTGEIAFSRDIDAEATAEIKYRTNTPAGYGILAFDKNGLYDAENSIIYTALGWTPEGAQALNITLSYTDEAGNIQTIQNGGPSDLDIGYLDGFATGNLLNIEFGDQGKITGMFDNGKSAILAQVMLQEFTNPKALHFIEKNMFSDSLNAGKKTTISVPGVDGAGSVLAYSLEASNVSLAKEFVDMIRAQRGFQASSRIVRASDDMTRIAIEMKR
ncbi:MAG: flagellar hook-basal body complex protein [Candidatus Hydrogenedentota bacterium]